MITILRPSKNQKEKLKEVHALCVDFTVYLCSER